MKLKLFKATWGMTGGLNEQFEQIHAAGYAGVEAGVPGAKEAPEFKRLLKDCDLEYIAMAFTGGEGVAGHITSLKEQVERAKIFQPIQITVHSAADCWSFDDQKRYFEQALDVERKAGIALNHETHRGRAMFTPWGTAALLKALPELHIAADFSHFTCVCERLLHDQKENLELCIARTRHVHGRIGQEESPQVSDPRAPEFEGHVKTFMAWWEQIVRARKKSGAAWFSFTPEFGPPGYMPTLPYTRQPVADLWEVCLHVAKAFEKRYLETV